MPLYFKVCEYLPACSIYWVWKVQKDASGGNWESSLSQSLFWILNVKLCGSDGQMSSFSFLLVCLSPSLCLSFPLYKKCFWFGLWTLLWSTDAKWCFTLHSHLQVKNCSSPWWPSCRVTTMRVWLLGWGERATSSLVWPLRFHALHGSHDSGLFPTYRFKRTVPSLGATLIWIHKCIRILLSLKDTFLRTLIFDVKDTAVSRSTRGLRLSQLQDIDVWLLKLYLKLNSSLRGILIINSFREEVSFTDTNILYSHALCQYIHRENFRVLSPHFSFLYSFLWLDYWFTTSFGRYYPPALDSALLHFQVSSS